MNENCWVQNMLSTEYDFQPNCNADGTFAPKQCFLERWVFVNMRLYGIYLKIKYRHYIHVIRFLNRLVNM